MLTDQELGELVVKIQMDDVRAHELRTFLLVVTQDAELRGNLKLAGKVSHLERDIREKNCAANFLYLLSHSTLSPEKSPKDMARWGTTRAFAEKFSIVLSSGWKSHASASTPSSTRVPANNKKPNKPDILISTELYEILRSLEEFWDVRGLYLAA